MFAEADESVQEDAEVMEEVNALVDGMDLDELIEQAQIHNVVNDQELQQLEEEVVMSVKSSIDSCKLSKKDDDRTSRLIEKLSNMIVEDYEDNE